MDFNKDRKFISKMFDEISVSYDKMNHLMSAGQDLIWRKKAVKYLTSLDIKFKRILDLAAGSGDFGREFLKLNPELLFSADFSIEMLKINKKKLNSKKNIAIKADSEKLPFQNNFFDLCGISFGVRNFEHLEICISEIHRVLAANGLFCVIEMFKPAHETLFNKTFRFYFNKIVPGIGNLISRSKYAYNYLHSSVDNFIAVDRFISIAESGGFKLINKKNNFSDIVYSVCFQKV
jgi:demethylmenaquinone methyltransferase/2-methoxy-6-polyprenyl-1,4-benzoquinol methylase